MVVGVPAEQRRGQDRQAQEHVRGASRRSSACRRPCSPPIWGLETDFGAFIGDGPTLTSLATLAYDCRRPDLFRTQLIAAIKIIDRGDLTAGEMRGPWAGELGQLQFIPERYFDYGVDFDGDGRVNMMTSSADALASAANYLAEHRLATRRAVAAGGAGAGRRCRGIRRTSTIKLPLSQWAAWGVTQANGKALSTERARRLAAAADGAERPGVPRLPEFRRLSDLEQLAGLFDDRRLLRHAAGRRRPVEPRLERRSR